MNVKTVIGGVCAGVAGVAGIVVGVTQAQPAFVVIGVAFLVVTVFALLVGALAEPKVTPNSIGAKFLAVPDWALLVIGIILVGSFVAGGVMLAA